MPNPSLERTPTGKPLGPRCGQCHHPHRGPSASPAGAAQLKRYASQATAVWRSQPCGRFVGLPLQNTHCLRSAWASAIRSGTLAQASTRVKNTQVIQPIPIALLLAAAMALGWRISGRRGFFVLAVLWVAYAVYEYLMYIRVLCSGECNIRVDLLLIYPALLGSTLWASSAAALRAIKRRRDAASDD
jgi:hypothetical protein